MENPPYLALTRKVPLSHLHRPEERLQIGENHLAAARYHEAHALFAAAAAEDPDHCDAWHGRGLASFHLGDYARAAAEHGCACALSMQYHHYYHYQGSHQHLRRGVLYLRRKEYGKALEDLTRAIFLDHTNAEAFYQRARAHEALGDRAAAARDEEAGHRLDPALKDAAAGPAPESYDRDIAMDFDCARAVRLPERLRREFGVKMDEDPSAKAAAAISARRFGEALEWYGKALEERPGDPALLHGRAVARSHLGENDAALDDIKQALEITGLHPALCHDSGVLFRLRHRYRDAAELFSQAIAIEPEHANAYFGRGRVWLSLGEEVKAMEDLSRAIDISARQHDYYHHQAALHQLSRGHAFFRAGQTDLALNDYAKATDLAWDFADAWQARGDGYFRKGNFSEALLHYGKASSLAPEDENLRQLVLMTRERLAAHHAGNEGA